MRTTKGSSTTGYLFCVIPFEDDEYERAMRDLYRDARLKQNQVLMNMREDWAFTAFALVWCERKTTVSADIEEVSTTAAPVHPGKCVSSDQCADGAECDDGTCVKASAK